MSPSEFSVGTKVISGLGSLTRLAGEVEQSGARRLAVVADRGVADAGLLAEVLQGVDTTAIAVTLLVDPEFPEHSTGQVFDIDRANLPRGERESLNFVLDDMGWDGYLGFIQVTGDSLHIGCSPSSRAFFASVFQDAVKEK